MAVQSPNYADYMVGIQDPMSKAMQGFQVGSQARALWEKRKTAEANAALAEQQRIESAEMIAELKALSEKVRSGTVTENDYFATIARYPDLAKHYQSSLENLSEDEKRSYKSQALNLFSAVSSGQIDIAKDLLNQQIEASENSGDKRGKDAAEAMLKIMEANPESAKTSMGLFLASNLDDKEFSTILQKVMGFKSGATNETDIDDYVRDAQIAWKEEFGTEMPAKDRNKARLEFKRAQASEIKANTFAKNIEDIAAAEKLAYNAKLGTELAQIATAKDLIHAQGKLTEQESSAVAKNRMESNLAKLAKHYIDLDSQGGIVNIEKPTMENIWARTKSSGVGQAFQNALGTTEQSVRNSIKKIKPLLIQTIHQATDMSARGLDSEKELEFYLQAATDEKSDLQSNIAAIAVLSEAYGDGELAKMLEKSTTPKLMNNIRNRGESILNKRKKQVTEQKEKVPSYLKEVPSYLKELGIE